MRSEELTKVRALDLFADMKEETFDVMMAMAYFQAFPPHLHLITEGDPSDFLHVVVDGAVEMFAHANDRETTIYVVRPYSTFILAASALDAPYLMSARTIEKSHILMIPSVDVRAAMHACTAFSHAIMAELASCYRGVIKNTKNLKLRNATERLANYLLYCNETQGGHGVVTIDIEKRILASILGMSPENQSRAFSALKGHGVEVSGNKVRLTNIARLKRLAKPSPLLDDPGF
ncbi:cyclic nucleotide-binding domain-containing protein [Varunaivibrio sulfuroxidans]|nr:cyclic nucleotide-binding domain-containing protein [Varunaivibrio sulfuroxidans]WES32001.1 helix-turn-helix domain-containing protein [Varunaivibrio sulfuroxidans]